MRFYSPAGRLEHQIKAHNGFAFCVAFDPTDPARVLSAGVDRRVHLWNWSALGASPVRSWTTEFAFEWGLSQFAAFSPDGQHVAFAPDYDTVKVWDTRTGNELQTLPGHDGGAYCVAYSPDGRWIATGGLDAVVFLWDANNGKRLGSLRGHKGRIVRLGFVPNQSDTLFSGSWDGQVRFSNIRTLTREPNLPKGANP